MVRAVLQKNRPQSTGQAESERFDRYEKKYELIDNRIWLKGTSILVLETKEEQLEITGRLHRELKHFKRDKLMARVQENYYWLGIRDTVLFVVSKLFYFDQSLAIVNNQINQIKHCEICQKKQRKKRRRPLQPIQAEGPYNHLQVDCCDLGLLPNGLRYIVNFIDLFSKFAWCFPIKTKDSETILVCLKKLVEGNGRFHILQSDNGTEFKNHDVESFAASQNIGITLMFILNSSYVLQTFLFSNHF